MTDSPMQRQVLSVSQLNLRARQLLETHFSLLWIEGEISNFSRPSSGHWYFTLKDSNAQVRCAMFRNRNILVRNIPSQGQQVLVRARVSLYEGRGDYQLIIEHLEEAGFGNLQRQFEMLKQKLLTEGLFEQSRKRPLPFPPQHIGVVTSPSGAAIKDILTVLRRRYPLAPVSIFPVAVQGADAAPQICQAIANANQLSDCDVLIVGRGGGSLEDLWPFNEESVARAIAVSRIPIVSAVGHEIDTTISDYVADLRAPTPSAAAELLVPDKASLLFDLSRAESRLTRALHARLAASATQLQHLRQRLRHPGERLQHQSQRLDHLDIRLQQVIHKRLQFHTRTLQHLTERQEHLHPRKLLQQSQQRLNTLQHQLQRQINLKMQWEQQKLGKAVDLLQTVSPLKTLQRGYAIVTDQQGNVVTSHQSVSPGQQVNARLANAVLTCEVISSEAVREK